jgi:predicted dehydrogenase
MDARIQGETHDPYLGGDKMNFLSRRGFLQTSLASAAGVTFADHAVQAAPDGARSSANDRLHVAVIGIHGRGQDHVSGFAGRHNCLVTHICDADSEPRMHGPILDRVAKVQGVRPQFVQDLRRIMDDRSIHIVSIATPNHWHALAAIWAMQAGKDVYVEKPVSHNVSEGRRIVETARRTQRICQTGTQIRSSTGMQEAIRYLRSGQLGKLRVARALCYKRRGSIGRVQGHGRVPATVSYDLWCGPAPLQPPHRIRFHYDWHWFWEYGNGDLGNQGIHQMDVARWGLGKNELSRSVLSVGGRFGYVDDGETANTQICIFNYGDAELIFEVRGLPTQALRGATVGNIFHCTDGVLVCPGYSGAIAYSPRGEVIRRFGGSGDHYANFVQAVRSRRSSDLHADILEGHLSSALCHLGNISYRLGRQVAFGDPASAFRDDPEAAETFGRMTEHLRDNAVQTSKTNYRFGRRLTMDPKTEHFVNDADANRMLTREYRRGFEVPSRV